MDSSKLRQGQAAIILGAFKRKENIGQQVTLVKFVPPGEELHHDDGVHQGLFRGGLTGVWIVRGEELVRWLVEEDSTILSRSAAIAPQHLFPLGGKMLCSTSRRSVKA